MLFDLSIVAGCQYVLELHLGIHRNLSLLLNSIASVLQLARPLQLASYWQQFSIAACSTIADGIRVIRA